MQHWGPPELYSTSGEYCITPAVCYAIKYVGVYIPAGQRSVRIKLILPAQGGACAATGYHAVAGVIPKR